MTFKDELKQMDADDEMVKWVGNRTKAQAWSECKRADWMLLYAGQVGADKTTLIRIAADCAETALEFAPEDGVLACVWAIDAARRFVAGDAEIEEVTAAADAAGPCTYATTAAAYTAHAAAADSATSFAAGSASYAAHAAGSVARASYAARARTRYKALSRMADIVRKYIPHAPGR